MHLHSRRLGYRLWVHLLFMGLGACSPKPAQQDSATPWPVPHQTASLSAAPVMLRSASSGKVIDIVNGINADGARIQQYDAWGGPMQQWILDPTADGSVMLRNPLTNKVLDVTALSPDDGAILQLWTAWSGPNQRWNAQQQSDGSYVFVNVNSGKCLDLLGQRPDDGAAIGQWDCNGLTSQQWIPDSVSASNAAFCGDGVCGSNESYLSCAQDCQHRVGVFYSGWHWPAYTATNMLAQNGQPVISVEQLLESRQEDGSPGGTGLHFNDLLRSSNMEGWASSFYYQHFPAGGPYCIVHQRAPGDLNYDPSHEGSYGGYSAPDCPGYAETVRRQAQQMVAAGIDFVVVDGTNIAGYDSFTDGIQQRPFEVLVQEFTALRAQGIATPEIAMWQRFPESPVAAGDGGDWSYRHVLAIYNDPAYSSVIMHDANSGKKVYFYPDLGNFDPAYVDLINSNGGNNDIVSVPMWAYAQKANQWSFMSACQQGGEIDDGDCNQPWTPSSVLGSQIAVVPTYQIGWASLPWQAAGLLNGVTLRKQFATAFAKQADYLLLSSWNENIAQPGNNGPSMGLETDGTGNTVAFVDNFGAEFSRDIEPSQELGSFVYDLVSSCLRVYRSGVTTCNDPGEACCQGGNFSDSFARFDGPQGKFVLYAQPAPGRTPLYSCQAVGDPFFSSDANCEGQTGLGLVGYTSDKRGGATLRSLYRCVQTGTTVHAYTLTAACPGGMDLEAVLGYVR